VGQLDNYLSTEAQSELQLFNDFAAQNQTQALAQLG
jgi:hypothetical protein